MKRTLKSLNSILKNKEMLETVYTLVMLAPYFPTKLEELIIYTEALSKHTFSGYSPIEIVNICMRRVFKLQEDKIKNNKLITL